MGGRWYSPHCEERTGGGTGFGVSGREKLRFEAFWVAARLELGDIWVVWERSEKELVTWKLSARR